MARSLPASDGRISRSRVLAFQRLRLHPEPVNQEGLYGSSTVSGNVARVAIAEFVGTFFLVLAGTSEATAAELKLAIAGQAAGSLAVGLTFGLALVAMVYTFGHVSGCHLNPAVTVGLAACGKFPLKYVPFYVVSQFAGAFTASAAVWGIFGEQARQAASLGATQPAGHSGELTVFLVEAVMTFFLVVVICSVATDNRAHPAIAGIAVGFTLAVCVLVAGPVSGGGVNPARAIAPMIMASEFKDIWAYVIGPMTGGIMGALLYSRYLAAAQKPAEAEPG